VTPLQHVDGQRRPGVGAVAGAVAFGCSALVVVVLAVLAVRSATRLELRWDTFAYHLPFAAARGGLPIPYVMNEGMYPFFQGFPPLPDLVQGLLWRATGSINATGVVNFLAFGIFLAYAHIVLRAPFWLVALISLSTPMVLIHTTVSYVDLFANAWLAIGLSSCVFGFLFPDRMSRPVLLGGLIGLIGAAWSKYQLVPIVAVVFCILAVIALRPGGVTSVSRRRVMVLLGLAVLIAAFPYIKNLVLYSNPFWPERMPILGAMFPYLRDDVAAGIGQQRPTGLRDAPQYQVFFRSLFEIDLPTHYDYRPRWIIDQGNASTAFRMGGFWGVGVVVFLATMSAMLIAYRRRPGLIAIAAAMAMLCFVAVLPQSHELRYYMFIPLTWAATIGMLWPHIRRRWPAAGLGVVVIVAALFSYMASENLTYYRLGKTDLADAASAWGASPWWSKLQAGHSYCAVGFFPAAMLLTGPTMSEFSIVDRTDPALCPRGTAIVTPQGIQAP